MKKLYTLSLVLLASAYSFGQTVLTESFNYTAGQNIGGNTTTPNDPTGANNWTTQSNTSGNSGTIDVIAGSLSYTGLQASVGNKILLPGNNTAVPRDVNRAITPNAADNVLYYSALINVIDNAQLSATPNYFMGLGASTTAFGARLGINSSTGTNYRLSIQNTSGGTPTFTEFTQDLNFGTTYLVVVKYDKSASPTNATLWVNPASLGGAEPTTGSVSNNSGTTAFPIFANIFLRNAITSGAGTPKAHIDEIRVGNTWASVTPQATASLTDNAIAGLKVYPNPVSGNNFYISSDATAVKSVAVYDVLGKQVINTKVENEAAINVSNLNAGVYIVKITEEGKTATRKLVIK